MERELNSPESAVVIWMVQNAPMPGKKISHLAPKISALRVVAACGCGCPSIDFKKDGQSRPWRPIGDARGISPEGIRVGVILWGGENEITGLEVYSETGEAQFSMPALEKLKTWDQPDEA